jgi:hypothetical protein
MVRRCLWIVLLLTSVGCVVRETRVVGPPPCPGGVWIEGRYGRRGHWHPAHWRCPGVIEVY